jgi:hypothetical protein
VYRAQLLVCKLCSIIVGSQTRFTRITGKHVFVQAHNDVILSFTLTDTHAAQAELHPHAHPLGGLGCHDDKLRDEQQKCALRVSSTQNFMRHCYVAEHSCCRHTTILATLSSA